VDIDSSTLNTEDLAYAQSLTIDDIMEMEFDGAVIAADGCHVDPDGKCPHGHQSPLITLSYI